MIDVNINSDGEEIHDGPATTVENMDNSFNDTSTITPTMPQRLTGETLQRRYGRLRMHRRNAVVTTMFSDNDLEQLRRVFAENNTPNPSSNTYRVRNDQPLHNIRETSEETESLENYNDGDDIHG